MKDYLVELIAQFKRATGTKNVDVNSQEFISEFSEWVLSRKSMGNDYASFIKNMSVYPTITSKTSVEVGKGKMDSIASNLGISMITPYLDENDSTSFFVFDGTPIIIRDNKNNEQRQIEAIDTQYVRRFLTHNPYEQSSIKGWEQLHNNGENITIGIFGSTHDRDIKSKIKQLEDLKDRMIDRYIEDFTEIGDSYYYAISSTEKIKEKELYYTR